jgi:glutathione synthase/RimK-type ligase-like ATP-grasp enzyme
MITAIGLSGDATFDHFIEFAKRNSIPLRELCLRKLLGEPWLFSLPDDGSSFVTIDGSRIDLDPYSSVYCRLIDLSPVLSSSDAIRWQKMLAAISAWLEVIPAVVVNRPTAGSDNGSKPLHESILSGFGFTVAESITTSEISDIMGFSSRFPIILKAIAGARGTSRLVGRIDFNTFDRRSGPVHLQRFVRGDDLRVHVVGKTVIAERITSTAVDYRSAAAENVFRAATLSEDLRTTLISTTRRLGLEFAGWDFKVDDRDHMICLEVNPMPGYSVYDKRCDGAITKALIEHLITT